MAALATLTLPAPVPSATHRVGAITLDLDAHLLAGPRGTVRLAPTAFAILERLMRKPGAIVSRAMFMEAMYPDPDDEPNTAVEVLRSLLSELRGTIRTLGERNVTIVAELGSGYVLMVRK